MDGIKDEIYPDDDSLDGLGTVDAGAVSGNRSVVYAALRFFSGTGIWNMVEKYGGESV